jgi:hypothetical protein
MMADPLEVVLASPWVGMPKCQTCRGMGGYDGKGCRRKEGWRTGDGYLTTGNEMMKGFGNEHFHLHIIGNLQQNF